MCHEVSFAQQLGLEGVGGKLGGCGDCVGRVPVPDRPDDAREFIGHGAGGLVIAPTVVHGDGPLLERGQLLLGAPATVGGHQHSRAAMDEQIAQIAVAAFTDAAQLAASPGRVLARRRAQLAHRAVFTWVQQRLVEA